ncbi:MAG: hypothetical protein ACYTA5_18335 [Planctomycetota bacterium]|jgi:hypothetical protein
MLCGWIGDYAIVWTRSVGTAAITARLRDNVVGITVSRFYKPDYALIYKTDQLYSTVYRMKPFIFETGTRQYLSTKEYPVPCKGVYCTFPVWLLLVVSLIYPATSIIYTQLRKHYRKKKGVCLNCGYNLFGNVTNICPECGTTFDPKLLEQNMNNNPPKEKESS